MGDATDSGEAAARTRSSSFRDLMRPPTTEFACEPVCDSQWELVDLWEQADAALTTEFYEKLLWPSYAERLAPLEFYLAALSSEGREHPGIGELHILVLRSRSAGGDSSNGVALGGGIMFVYYPEINVGLFLYLVVDHRFRVPTPGGLDATLVHAAMRIMDQSAHSTGNLAGCNAFFMETDETDPGGATGPPATFESPQQQHRMLHALGFRLVDIGYVAPRRDAAGPRPRHLTVFLTPKIPTYPLDDSQRRYLPSRLLHHFVEHHWWSMREIERVFSVGAHARPVDAEVAGETQAPVPDPALEAPLASMLAQISVRDKVPLLDLPWSAKTWTLVDQWEDYNEALVRRFYAELMEPRFDSSEIEPLSSFETALSAEGRENEWYPDLHVLLALSWPAAAASAGDLPADSASPSNLEPEIAGGLVFEYHPAQNLGLITYFVLRGPSDAAADTGSARSVAELSHLLGSAALNQSTASFATSVNDAPFTPQEAPPRVARTPSGLWGPTSSPGVRRMNSAILGGGEVPATAAALDDAAALALGTDAVRLPMLLVSQALSVLDMNAKSRGNLAGCNMILLEAYFPPATGGGGGEASAAEDTPLGTPPTASLANSLPVAAFPTIHEGVVATADALAPVPPVKPSGTTTGVLDMTQEHLLLWQLGFRLLNFQYVMPPFSLKQGKSTRFLLTVYLPPLVSAGIMTRSSGGEARHLLPSGAVKQFVARQWLNAYRQGHLAEAPATDADYVRMTRQLALQQTIALRDLPWASGVYTFKDLWEEYDETLLSRFYEQVLRPAYAAHPDELEPLATLQRAFDPQMRTDRQLLDLHVVLALRFEGSGGGYALSIEGGCVFEYYADINCGLLSYLVVRPEQHDGPLMSLLVEQVVDLLDENARSEGHMSGCNCVFWEANFEDDAGSRRRPMASHEFAHRMGFRQLDMSYMVPPVSPEFPNKLTDYMLAVLLTSHIPHMPFEEGYQFGVPSSVVAKFLRAIWTSAYATGRITSPPTEDRDFVRSLRQLEVRHMIPLLDLPWSVKTWTYVDLWQDYDEALLRRFYSSLLVPNFPIQDELEPLSLYLQVLGPEFRDQCETAADVDALATPECHMILALRWEENDQVLFGGGIVAEYYNRTNCGLLTYLVVHKSSRGQGLAGKLVARAVDVLDKNAKKRGKLAGCNAVFLETNSADKITPEQDVMDPRMRHVIYHKMGFRLVDYAYVMPPLAPGQNKVDFLLLTVYQTSSIPRDPFQPKRFYLPSQLLRNFVRAQWDGAIAKGNLVGPPDRDVDFARTMNMLDVTEKVPLLDLPWTSTKPFACVDMWEDFDPDILRHFYHALVVPRFHESNVEPLENWLSRLAAAPGCAAAGLGGADAVSGPTSPVAAPPCELHVLVAFDLNRYEEFFSTSHQRCSSASIYRRSLIGGLVFEYYPVTNCTLITYMAVSCSDDVRARLAKFLLHRALYICDTDAKRHGHLAGCNAIFFETDLTAANDAPAADESPSSTFMLPAGYRFRDPLDRTFLYQQGFRALDFEYFQPPVRKDQRDARSVCLAVLITPRIPQWVPDGVEDAALVRRYVPATLMQHFIEVLWDNECAVIDYDEHRLIPAYQRMMANLADCELQGGYIWVLDAQEPAAACAALPPAALPATPTRKARHPRTRRHHRRSSSSSSSVSSLASAHSSYRHTRSHSASTRSLFDESAA